MDIEKMQEVLATKCMGWHRVKYHGVWSDWYDDQNKSMCLAPLWQPDCKWDQCGMVIEAMREKGWRCNLNDSYYPNVKASWYRVGEPFWHYDGEGTECEARMLAAARALEVGDE